jgi:hypothetical protein
MKPVRQKNVLQAAVLVVLAALVVPAGILGEAVVAADAHPLVVAVDAAVVAMGVRAHGSQ